LVTRNATFFVHSLLPDHKIKTPYIKTTEKCS